MNMMQSMLFRNALGCTAELMKTPKGFRVTEWNGFGMTHREFFQTYGKAISYIYGNGYRKL